MKKMLVSLGVGAMALAAGSSAFAATFSPASTTRVFSGAMALEQTTPLTCAVSLTVQTNAAGNGASVTAGSTSPGDFQCAFVSPTFTPVWPVVATPATGTAGAQVPGLTVSQFKAVSLAGSCGTAASNTLTATWVDGTGGAPDQIVLARLPGVDGVAWGSPARCYFSGPLTSTDGALSIYY